MSSKIGISGPIIKNKWTISSSFRRSFYDLIPRIQNSLNPNIQDIILYNFSDFHIKSKFKINQNNSLSFFIYKSNDHWISKDKSTSTSLSQLDENGIKWGNQLSSLTWTTKYNASVFQNVSFLINQYKFALLSETNSTWTNDQGESENQEISTTYQSSIQDFGFKYKLDYLINQNHYLRIGTEITHHTLVPGQSRSISKDNGLISHDTLSSINKHRNIESRTFIEDEITFNKFSFNLGVSVSSLHLKNKSYWALEPRISTKYELSKKINLQISVSKMVQYLHVLSNNNLGLPTDLWVSSNNKIPPSRSWIYALGFEHHLFRDYNLIIESYFKKMNGLIEYREGASFLLYGKQWEEKVLSNGKGKSLGIEFQIKKSIKPFTGWIAYTISKTDRTFTDLNNGKSFPYKYDRLHELDILFSWHPNKKWNFQLNWKFHSGNPASFPIGFYPNIFYEGELSGSGVSNDIFELPDFSNYLTDTNSIPIYAGKNQERLPNYHRLDLAINRAFNYKNTSHNINFSIYNAYNRKNTFFVTHGYENQVVNFDTYKKNRKGTLNSFSQFPIIPSLSYNIKF